jgi:hypothetical protein
MRSRVVKDGDAGWKLAPNANYRQRPTDGIQQIYASAQ